MSSCLMRCILLAEHVWHSSQCYQGTIVPGTCRSSSPLVALQRHIFRASPGVYSAQHGWLSSAVEPTWQSLPKKAKGHAHKDAADSASGYQWHSPSHRAQWRQPSPI